MTEAAVYHTDFVSVQNATCTPVYNTDSKLELKVNMVNKLEIFHFLVAYLWVS